MAAARYFPAINPIDSYSEYPDMVAGWWAEHADPGWKEMRAQALELLQEDYQLQRIVKIIGEEALPDAQRLTLEAARWLKEGFLQQSAFDKVDMFCLPAKQMKMLKLILAPTGRPKRCWPKGSLSIRYRTGGVGSPDAHEIRHQGGRAG